jgi:hypothetical protein
VRERCAPNGLSLGRKLYVRWHPSQTLVFFYA